MLDIIIPILNEEEILTQQQDYYKELNQHGRLIFADGGSDDQTVHIASQYGEVVHSRRGKSYQKNAAAHHSDSKYILFLHVDSFVKPAAIRSMLESLKQGQSYGCFKLSIMDNGWIFRIYEWAVNLRARRMSIVDGDLGFFVRRKIFNELNGFDEIPIMDDIVFSKRIRKNI